MHQFDVPSTKSAAMNKWTYELNKLAGDIEAEKLETQAKEENSQDELDEEGPCPDNNEGWVNERDDVWERDKWVRGKYPAHMCFIDEGKWMSKQELYSIS